MFTGPPLPPFNYSLYRYRPAGSYGRTYRGSSGSLPPDRGPDKTPTNSSLLFWAVGLPGLIGLVVIAVLFCFLELSGRIGHRKPDPPQANVVKEIILKKGIKD